MVDVGNVARDDVEDDRNGRRRWGGRGDDVAAFERASARAGEDDDGARTGCVGARRARRVGGANDERGIRAVAMTNDDPEPRGSAALATGSYDGAATIRRWRVHDAVYEASASTVKPHRESVLSLTFSPDGAFLVTGSGDGVARVWSADEKCSLKKVNIFNN